MFSKHGMVLADERKMNALTNARVVYMEIKQIDELPRRAYCNDLSMFILVIEEWTTLIRARSWLWRPYLELDVIHILHIDISLSFQSSGEWRRTTGGWKALLRCVLFGLCQWVDGWVASSTMAHASMFECVSSIICNPYPGNEVVCQSRIVKSLQWISDISSEWKCWWVDLVGSRWKMWTIYMTWFYLVWNDTPYEHSHAEPWFRTM